MNKKRICALFLSVAVFFGTPVFISAENSQSLGTAIEMMFSKQAALNSFSSEEERLGAMQLVKSAGGLELYVDAQNADIAVVDTKTGAAWFSSPINISGDSIASETIRQYMASQLRISMLDASNSEVELLSYRDCILNEQCEIYITDLGLTLAMTLGNEDQRRLAPEAIPASSMEKYILPKLEGRALSKVEYFYKKYDVKEMTERQIENISKKYPLVLKEPIYVLKSVTDTEAEEVESYIKETDYTFEIMERDLESLGIEISENTSPYVKIKINYIIDENGEFKAEIDCDDIEYDSESFVLNKIYLLEYFAAADMSDQNGFLILPDGSGTVMNFNSNGDKTNTELTLDVYGRDMALSYSSQAVTNESTVIPAYAISSSKGSMLCFIENGAESSSIKVSAGGTNSSLAAVGSVLGFCDVDYFDYTEIGSVNTWVISDKTVYNGKYSVSCKFLPPNSTYSEIAVSCREMLIKSGKLVKSENAQNTDLNIGLLGAVEYLDRVLFIPVNHLIPLTTVEDVKLIAEDLIKNGADNLTLRYIGWSSGGLKNSTADADVLQVLGSKKEMRELSADLSDMGVGFYPDFRFQTVYKNNLFDGFLISRDAVRMLNRQYANVYKMNLASNSQDNSYRHYLLNSKKVSALYNRVKKSFKAYGSEGISLSTLGGLLYSDKNSKNPYGRYTALEANTEIIADASENYSVMLETGNSYTWSYADKIIGLPTASGGFAQCDYSIPFVQTVLHGYIPYTTPAINISGDAVQEFLRAVETGSQIYFELTAQNGEKLKNTDFSYAYSTDYECWADTVKEYYERWSDIFSSLGSATIEDHYTVIDGVQATVYSDGTAVIVNYRDEAFTYNGNEIPGKDFISIKQR